MEDNPSVCSYLGKYKRGEWRVFEQTFKNIDDVLWKEAGCATELDYTEQKAWFSTTLTRTLS